MRSYFILKLRKDLAEEKKITKRQATGMGQSLP